MNTMEATFISRPIQSIARWKYMVQEVRHHPPVDVDLSDLSPPCAICGNLWKPVETCGNLWKPAEIARVSQPCFFHQEVAKDEAAQEEIFLGVSA